MDNTIALSLERITHALERIADQGDRVEVIDGGPQPPKPQLYHMHFREGFIGVTIAGDNENFDDCIKKSTDAMHEFGDYRYWRGERDGQNILKIEKKEYMNRIRSQIENELELWRDNVESEPVGTDHYKDLFHYRVDRIIDIAVMAALSPQPQPRTETTGTDALTPTKGENK